MLLGLTNCFRNYVIINITKLFISFILRDMIDYYMKTYKIVV